MASRAHRRQHLTIALAGAVFEIILSQYQKETNEDKRDDKAIDLLKRLLHTCDQAKTVVGKSSGQISVKDRLEIKRQFDKLNCKFIVRSRFATMAGVSFIIDLLVDQLAVIHKQSEKYKAFNNLLDSVIAFERYVDKDKKYESDIGLLEADIVREAIR